MRLSSVAAVANIVAGVAIAWATDAPVVRSSPPSAYALATMPQGGSKDIDALVSVITNPTGGGGVEVTININGADNYEGGPFCK
jgi:imidazolonepropionase-like amidohydrolase